MEWLILVVGLLYLRLVWIFFDAIWVWTCWLQCELGRELWCGVMASQAEQVVIFCLDTIDIFFGKDAEEQIALLERIPYVKAVPDGWERVMGIKY